MPGWIGPARSGSLAARRVRPTWAQIFADVTQQPVEVAEAEEVGAQGAAICAAVAGGLYPDLGTAAAAMTRVGRRHEPDKTLATLYETRFKQFRELDRGMLTLLG